MSVPKHYVFDDEGKLTEVRGYKDEVVVERWGIVYDEEDKPVGLKPLPIKEVIPQSILDKIKFWRKPKPLTQILSIDFIGLIQYIGMIYKIRKVVTIEEILEILNIKKVDVIGEITTIRDLVHTPPSFLVNPFFHQGFAGWTKQGKIDIITESYLDTFIRFTSGIGGQLKQDFPIPLSVDWLEEFYFFLRSGTIDTNIIKIVIGYSDHIFGEQQFQVTEANKWQKKVITPTSGKHIQDFYIKHDSLVPACDFGWLRTRF